MVCKIVGFGEMKDFKEVKNYLEKTLFNAVVLLDIKEFILCNENMFCIMAENILNKLNEKENISISKENYDTSAITLLFENCKTEEDLCKLISFVASEYYYGNCVSFVKEEYYLKA